MGFSADSPEIAGCVLSLKEMSVRAENYRRAQEEYDVQLAEIKRQREIDANLVLMQFGLGIASGGGRNNSSSGSRLLPTLPPPPPPITVVTPSGNRYSCSTFANTVTCR